MHGIHPDFREADPGVWGVPQKTINDVLLYSVRLKEAKLSFCFAEVDIGA